MKEKNGEKREHKKNWKECWASVEDIQDFLMDRILLRHNVIIRRVEYRLPSNYEHDGTGNNAQFLSDPTGNRRWLPFEVESIESPRDHPFNYEEIYSQAYALYRQGFQYWFSQDEIQRLAVHNKSFEAPRLEDELVMQFFRQPVGNESGEFMSVSLAIQLVGANITQKLSHVMMGRAFKNQGFLPKTCRNVRGYVVVRRSADEMRAMRYAMAAAPDNTDTDDTDVF